MRSSFGFVFLLNCNLVDVLINMLILHKLQKKLMITLEQMLLHAMNVLGSIPKNIIFNCSKIKLCFHFLFNAIILFINKSLLNYIIEFFRVEFLLPLGSTEIQLLNWKVEKVNQGKLGKFNCSVQQPNFCTSEWK